MRKADFWKKVTGVLLTTVMVASMLTGCGGSSDSKESGKETGGDSSELVTVNMASPTKLASMDLCWVTVADKMGYFEDEGIKVNLIECTDGSDPKMVASGQAEFGGWSPSVGLSAVDNGVTNIQAVCNNVRSNMFGIAYNKEGGVTDWADINGKAIASMTDNFSVIYNPILAAAGVDTGSVEYVSYGSSEYEALDSNQAPVMGTWLSEYYMCQGMGYDWGYLSGDDVLPQISNSVWVNTEYAEKNPEVVKGFVRAVCKSMYFCYLNPEAAADMVLNTYPSIEITWEGAVGAIEGNVKGMLGMTEEDAKACIDNHLIGVYDMAIVEQTIQNLVDGGAIKEKLDAATYYTNDYVDTGWDYATVEADAKAYTCTSKTYENAGK